MTRSIVLEVTDAESLAILNALNYFGHGCSASECSTLLGIDQGAVRDLFQKIRDIQAQPDGPAKEA